MIRALLNALLFLPTRAIEQTPGQAGLAYRELELETDDGERLHGWWVPARSTTAGHVLLCHGNAGNIGDRILHAALLTSVGFDVLLFDYRGYGRSSGTPSEEGTYRDARAALTCLLGQPGVDMSRVLYLGESLGGAVAIELALTRPPAALVLLSAFTSVREMARVHHGPIAEKLAPDAYPNLRRIRDLRTPLLILHGDDDMIVPPRHATALYEAAPDPKRIRLVSHVGHNDLVSNAGPLLAREIAAWAHRLPAPPGRRTRNPR